MKPKIVLRADGNSSIGFGHIYRLLALADILKEQYYLVFALFDTSDFIKQEIISYCNEMILISGELPFKTPDEIAAKEEIKFDLDDVLTGDETVVLDGYYFGQNYQKLVKQKNYGLVCIDDLATSYFYADAVVNHAPEIERNKYKTEPYTKLYTGLEYAMLRKPFLEPANVSGKKNDDAFISFGGSDYLKITAKLVNFLMDMREFNILHIMCSSSFPEEMMIELVSLSKRTQKVKIYQNLGASEIVTIMDSCKYAFVSASTVLLEAYSRNLICFTGYYTTNQLFIYNGFIKENKAIGLGDLKSLRSSLIREVLTQAANVQTCTDLLSSKKNLEHIFELATN